MSFKIIFFVVSCVLLSRRRRACSFDFLFFCMGGNFVWAARPLKLYNSTTWIKTCKYLGYLRLGFAEILWTTCQVLDWLVEPKYLQVLDEELWHVVLRILRACYVLRATCYVLRATCYVLVRLVLLSSIMHSA